MTFYVQRQPGCLRAFPRPHLTVTLKDGRVIATPLWWYPRLLAATPEQRSACELSPFGVHWPDLDEGLSVAGMLKGNKAPGAKPPTHAPKAAE